MKSTVQGARYPAELILCVLSFSACGIARADSVDLAFDIHRVDVGHSTAAVAILPETRGEGPYVAVVGGDVVTVLKHESDGTFEIHEVIPAGEHPVDVAVGDLDQDGALDLVVSNHETTYLTLIFGADSGFLEGRSGRLAIDVSPHPHAVSVADIDEDGHQDIVVDDRDRNRLRVYRGDGGGSFEASHAISVGGDPYRGMSLADINSDGHLDVITPNPRSLAIRLGDGTGSFATARSLESASVPPFSSVVGDFNADGLLDVAAGSGEGAGYVVAWLGSGDGSFEAAPGSPFPIATGPTKLGSGDVNRDGIDDILATSYLGGEIAIVLGGQVELRQTRIALEGNPWGVAVGDLTGDSRIDVVIANDSEDQITILLGRRP